MTTGLDNIFHAQQVIWPVSSFKRIGKVCMITLHSLSPWTWLFSHQSCLIVKYLSYNIGLGYMTIMKIFSASTSTIM